MIYELYDKHTDKIDGEFDLRAQAEAAKWVKEMSGEFNWRVRAVREDS